jgi:NADP-dependent 3-hydroxy acid dehydrogenase YdfG
VEAKLTDTVALITGSSSRTGRAVARRLAAEGAAVALVARRRDGLDDLASAICGDGGTALVVQADVTRRQEAFSAVERTVAQLGRLDIVVNNAGIMPPGPVEDSRTDDWHDMVALNVQGLLHVTHAALLHLVRAANDSSRGVADLVNTSSTAGGAAGPGSTVHDLTASAVLAFSEVVRQEMLGQRIRVSVVQPMRPEDIADAVAHIVTRDAEWPSMNSSNGTVDPASKASPATSGNASSP